MKNSLELDRPSSIFSSSDVHISSPSVLFSPHRLNPLADIDSTSTLSWGKDLSLLIPNIKYSNSPRDLRLVVHGSSGGKVHDLLKYVVKTKILMELALTVLRICLKWLKRSQKRKK